MLAMLILLLAVCLGMLTIRFQRIFMEYAVNVCEDSAIKETNTLMEDEVFSHPDEFADLVVLERDSDNRITALRTDIIAVGKVKARIVNGLFDRLDYLEETQTEVPLGTVFAPSLFTGMGPRVKVGLAGLAQMEARVRQRVYLGGHQPDAPPDSHRGARRLPHSHAVRRGRQGNRLDVPGHGHGYCRHGARTVRLYRRLRL